MSTKNTIGWLLERYGRITGFIVAICGASGYFAQLSGLPKLFSQPLAWVPICLGGMLLIWTTHLRLNPNEPKEEVLKGTGGLRQETTQVEKVYAKDHFSWFRKNASALQNLSLIIILAAWPIERLDWISDLIKPRPLYYELIRKPKIVMAKLHNTKDRADDTFDKLVRNHFKKRQATTSLFEFDPCGNTEEIENEKKALEAAKKCKADVFVHGSYTPTDTAIYAFLKISAIKSSWYTLEELMIGLGARTSTIEYLDGSIDTLLSLDLSASFFDSTLTDRVANYHKFVVFLEALTTLEKQDSVEKYLNEISGFNLTLANNEFDSLTSFDAVARNYKPRPAKLIRLPRAFDSVEPNLSSLIRRPRPWKLSQEYMLELSKARTEGHKTRDIAKILHKKESDLIIYPILENSSFVISTEYILEALHNNKTIYYFVRKDKYSSEISANTYTKEFIIESIKSSHDKRIPGKPSKLYENNPMLRSYLFVKDTSFRVKYHPTATPYHLTEFLFPVKYRISTSMGVGTNCTLKLKFATVAPSDSYLYNKYGYCSNGFPAHYVIYSIEDCKVKVDIIIKYCVDMNCITDEIIVEYDISPIS